MEPFSPSPVKPLSKRQNVRHKSSTPESPRNPSHAQMMSMYETPPPVPSSYYPTPPDPYMGSMSGKPVDPRRKIPVTRAPPEGTPNGRKLADEESGLMTHFCDDHRNSNLVVPFGGSPGCNLERNPLAADALAQLSSCPITSSHSNDSLDGKVLDEKTIILVADPSNLKQPSEQVEFDTSIACDTGTDRKSESSETDAKQDNVAPPAGIETADRSCNVRAIDNGLTPVTNQSECKNLVRRPDPPDIFASDATISWINGTRHVAVYPAPTLVRPSCGAAPNVDDRSLPVTDSFVLGNALASDNKENALPENTEHLVQGSVSTSPSDSNKASLNLDSHHSVTDEFPAPSPPTTPLVGDDDSGSIEEEKKTPKMIQPWILELFGPLYEGTTDHDYVGRRVVKEYWGKWYLGTIVRYFRDYEVETNIPLWHILFDDGDARDMDESEVKEFLGIYQEDDWKARDPSSNHYNPF
ncbi:hypothetical protein FisN_2Lh569 [Fistulifera solaris]|uniref:PTM/DIR17-like Tudor domain-containing protein n=1 Tax=Fistulifera solaris TaxID=1519565 RepID=A0A1Z5JAM5_FISSO|nr:hypothetical protein FisN_2Lh569 [Fistulifera solaris]|eukprot:GAX11040.1 hypothetical protein FisN_2Lh569 [Fistulifera solaris]